MPVSEPVVVLRKAFFFEAKREAGAAEKAKAGAAPATVSGEPLSNKVTETSRGFGKAGQRH
jgi:hypothetical protein